MSGTSDVCAVAQVAQLATTTCATNFILPIVSLAPFVQIVPLTGKTKLVAQVVVASCATCATTKYYAQQPLVALNHSG